VCKQRWRHKLPGRFLKRGGITISTWFRENLHIKGGMLKLRRGQQRVDETVSSNPNKAKDEAGESRRVGKKPKKVRGNGRRRKKEIADEQAKSWEQGAGKTLTKGKFWGKKATGE